MNETAARAENVTKVYGWGETRVTALDGLSVSVNRGDFTAVMGPSGSGKSTLMHCMAGLDEVTKGSVYIGDQDLSTLNDRRLTRLRRERIGFIFQAFNLVPTLTASENITLPLDLAGRMPDPDWFDQVVETLGLSDRLSHRPQELSGGQQQRVAIARALAAKPKIILADEPTGNLDTETGLKVIDLLFRLNQEQGTTLILVTHDESLTRRCDRCFRLTMGKLQQI